MTENPDENGQHTPRNEISGPALAGLDALMRAASESAGSGPRPVDKWNPPYCGDIGLRIRSDGVWLYQESPIGRMPLVKLFASILRKDDDGKTYLVTPAEKILVTVDDAPFLAVEMATAGTGENQTLTFRTNVDDVVTVGADHPLRFVHQQTSGGLKPYIRVRGRLEALCTRAIYADLASLAAPRDASKPNLGLWSGGVWWEMA